MTTTVEVQGAEAMQASLRTAAKRIEDAAAVNREVADLVASSVRAPRRTGRLAASVRPLASTSEASVGSDLVYAPVIHNGWPAHNISPNPFIADAFTSRADQIDAAYQRNAQHILDDVKGA